MAREPRRGRGVGLGRRQTMQARATLPKGANLALWLIAVLGVGLLGVLSLSLANVLPLQTSSGGVAYPAGRVAYFQFGETADTLWLADPQQPARREKILVLPHAREFGVVPSLAAAGGRFAFTALPPATAEPAPDTPADLWLAALDGQSEPVLLARGVDLLVAPVWSPDGASLVARRSAGAYQLVALDAASGGERLLVASEAALFPVAFAPASPAGRPDGARLYYVELTRAGSELLAVDLATSATARVARLADGLTRDWALSPAGDRLAYLTLNVDQDSVSTRAFVLDLATTAVTPIGEADADAFSPVWSADGALAIGSLRDGRAGAGLIRISDGRASRLPGPARGFDVPLAATSDGGFVVRAFEGASTAAPGRSVLAVVGAGGRRQTIATGEVTFLGWIEP